MSKCTELKPFKPCSEACQELGRNVVISLGDPTFPFPPWDTFTENGVPDGLSAALVEASLAAVGLIADCDYRIVSSPYTPLANGQSGTLQTGFNFAAQAFLTKYLVAQASWGPTLRRAANGGDFGIPYSDDVLDAVIYTSSFAPQGCLEEGQEARVGLIAPFVLTEQDLQFAPAPYNNPAAVVEFNQGDGDAIKAAFEAGEINAFLGFPGTTIEDSEGDNVIDVSCVTFATDNPTYAPLFNKAHPCATTFLLAYNEGLRRIVNNGIYRTIVEAIAPELTPWTPETFPDLSRDSKYVEDPVKDILGNRLLYRGDCNRARKHALRENCKRHERPLCDDRNLCPDCDKHKH